MNEYQYHDSSGTLHVFPPAGPVDVSMGWETQKIQTRNHDVFYHHWRTGLQGETIHHYAIVLPGGRGTKPWPIKGGFDIPQHDPAIDINLLNSDV